MRKLSNLLFFVATTAAFRPPSLSEELGCSPTISVLLGVSEGFYFDPLQVANDGNFARLRECELKHGRVAMLANLGVTVPPLLQELSQQQKWDLPIDWPSASIVENLLQLDSLDYLRILITCAFLETFVFIQRDPQDMPGDYGTGYFSVRDKGLHERALISELENGRLAMISLVVQIVAEAATHKDYIEQWTAVLHWGEAPNVVVVPFI